MEKALDSKLGEENKQSGDKRLVAKKQRGRWNQWGEGTMCLKKKQLVETSLHAAQVKLTTERIRSSQPWRQKTLVSDKSWTGFASSLPQSSYSSLHRCSCSFKLLFKQCENGLKVKISCFEDDIEKCLSEISTCHVPPQTNDALPFKERLSLLNKLEKAEARVQTMEAQVQNTKKWSCTVYVSSTYWVTVQYFVDG